MIGTLSGINVSPAAAKQFVLSGYPSTVTAGTPQTFTATAYDAYGNVATGYTGTVHFTSTDVHASLPANETVAAAQQGTFSFVATFNTLGSQTITATDTMTSTITGSATVTVNPAAVTVIATPPPPGVLAGSMFGLTVDERNARIRSIPLTMAA